MIDHCNDGPAVQHPPKILTVDEVRERLHMSPNTWRAFAKKHSVPEAFVSSPRRKLYSEAIINRLIDGTYSPAGGRDKQEPITRRARR